ncbi:MAG: ribose-phosphate pyrophosphokinase [Candidatus Binataceae bacterium]
MDLAILSGSSNVPLATAVASRLGIPLGRRLIARSPDEELHVEIQENVRACDVFLIQSTGPPIDRNLMELLFLTDACRRSGANHVTAIIPYFGYSRQDRSASGQQALGARLIADVLRTAGVGRVVAVDLHTASIESAFGMALEHLSAVGMFCDALPPLPSDSVLVAADMAALKMTERYARVLRLPIAIVAKVRVSAEEVVARSLIGDVQGRTPVIVDDIIITGGTIEAAVNAVVGAGAVPNATVVATHGLFVGSAAKRLTALPIARLLVTDSVEISSELKLPIEVISLAPTLAHVISRLHAGELLGELIARI